MAEKEKQDDYRVDVPMEEKPFSPPPRRPSSNSVNPVVSIANNPPISILCYCGASILMTVTNKYVFSGHHFNLNFFILCIQSVVCIIAIQLAKSTKLITYRDFNMDEARKWFPISLLLITMIYTSSKALQFLSIPVYTIFKNLTIILIAYGEVLWFGGSVGGMALFSFGLMVLSSVVAAWADIRAAVESYGSNASETAEALSTLNAGYIWMLLNCLSSASYVLGMRKRIKLTNFKDFDTMFYNNLLTIPVLILCSLLLEDWSRTNIELNFPAEQRNALIMAMLFSGASSLFISYASAWCVRVTSSTTYSMVGALNKLPIAVSGLIFFDAPVTLASVTAIGIGFVSGLVYAISKISQSRAKSGTLPTTSASSAAVRDGFRK